MERQKIILIVEDNDIHRKILCDALESRGYLVEGACDGFSALEKLEEKSYDFLITDNLMPGMEGLELIDEISRKKINIKSFLISGEFTKEITEKAKEKGVLECFDKPVSLKLMLKKLRKILCPI
jgi:two-component system cell cycle response regulator DivK